MSLLVSVGVSGWVGANVVTAAAARPAAGGRRRLRRRANPEISNLLTLTKPAPVAVTPKKHGLPALKSAVNKLGGRVIDRRTTLGKALDAWRLDLIDDLGGQDAMGEGGVVRTQRKPGPDPHGRV